MRRWLMTFEITFLGTTATLGAKAITFWSNMKTFGHLTHSTIYTYLTFLGDWWADKFERAASSRQSFDGPPSPARPVGLPQFTICPQAGLEPLGPTHRGPTRSGSLPCHRVHPLGDVQVPLQPSHSGLPSTNHFFSTVFWAKTSFGLMGDQGDMFACG